MREPNFPEATRAVKIKSVHWHPRTPVRVRAFIGAFEKITAPDLAGDFLQVGRVMFK